MENYTMGLSSAALAMLMAMSCNVHALVPSNVSASSSDGNSADNTVDNDLSTRWSAEGSDGSQWLQYDFSDIANLSAVNIAFYKGESRSTYFQIQSSEDGNNWTVELDAVGSATTAELETFTLDETVTASYVRIVGFGNSSNSWNSITEVTFEEAVVEPDPGTEEPEPVDPEPIDATALASTDDGNVAENTLDGSLETRWSAKGSGEWLRLDLGSDQLLDDVQLAFYKGDSRESSFSIEVSSDDDTWTTVVSQTNSSGNSSELETFTFDEVTARYIRYSGYGNSLNSWNSITEFTVTAATEDEIDPGDGETDPGDGETDPGDGETDPGDGETDPGDSETDPGDGSIDPGEGVTGDTYTATPDTLNDVLAIAVGGDEIIVTGSGEISLKNLSFDSPVLIRAETIGAQQIENATISNSNNITLQGFLFGPSNDVSTLIKIVNSTNIRISRNYFDHLNVTEGQSSLVVTESSQYIEIDHNEFHDKNISVVDGEKNTGSYIKFQYDDGQMTKDAHIHHNYFNNITPYLVDGVPAGDSDREAIVMGISSSQDIVTNHLVEYNLFENCDGENEIITVKTSNNTFRYNTFKNSMGSLSFRLGHDNTAYGNYFYGTGASDDVTDDNYQTGGIRVYGAGHSVYDNYMEGLSGTSWRLPLLVDNGDTSDSSNGDSHQTPTDVSIVNNTIVDSIGGGIYIGRDDSKYKNTPTAITVTGNTVIGSEGILFNNYSDDSSNTWSGNSAYATGSATENGGGALNSSELEILSSVPSITKPTLLIPSDVGTAAE